MRALLLVLLCSVALADPSPAPERLAPEDLVAAVCMDVEAENIELRARVNALLKADQDRRRFALGAKYRMGDGDSFDPRDGRIARKKTTRR